MAKRLFVGSLLEPAQAQLLSQLKQELSPIFEQWWNCKLRWVKAEKLHITWLFLGDTEAKLEAEILEKLKSQLAGLKPFELQYDQLEFFGKEPRPTAMVLTPSSPSEQVIELGNSLRKSIGHFCQSKADHVFRPHLTLLRFPRDEQQKFSLHKPLDLSAYLPLAQKIEHVSLIESHTGLTSQSYEIIKSFP